MTGRFRVLLALAALILTQATFAAADSDGQTEDQDASSKYASLMNRATGKVRNWVNNAGEQLLDKLLGTRDDDGFTAMESPENFANKYRESPRDGDTDLASSLDSSDEAETFKYGSRLNTGRDSSGRGRKVKSYKVSGNDVSLSEDDEVHSRVKRGTNGDGIPDEFEFTLEALSPFDQSNPEFHIGNIIEYKLIIHASIVETDVQVEIFSELAGGPYFMVSNVRVGTIGQNFNSSIKDNAVIRYHSKFNDGRWDYATVDMGKISNDASETSIDASSQIEVLFDVLALPHDGYVAGNLYRVSVGAMYQSESYVTVAQDDLTYADYTEKTAIDATFSISGPENLNLGTTGVWTIEAAVYDLYSDIALDVLAPLHTPGIMTIDMISVASVGENYQHSSIAFDDGGNFTRSTYENYGDYGRLNLGKIVNSGYHSDNTNLTSNTLTFEVAITMLDHDYNTTDPYTVGFTLWKKDPTSVEIMWSAQETVQAVNESLASLSTSPVFTWGPNVETVVVGGRFSVLLNMSVPENTSARYVMEASIPVNDSKAMIDIEGVRLSRVGHNLPHVRIWQESNNITYQSDQTDNTNTDFISLDLGIITNTGSRTGSDDNILQFELRMKMLPDCESYYDPGEKMYLSLGMKHAEDYYWVGRTSITYTNSSIEYNSDMVPEFSFTNVMGSDAMIYPDSAAVFDLDMNVPAGADYAPFLMEISTTNFSSDASGDLRIISMELIHTGKALFLEDVKDANLTYAIDEEDDMERPIYTMGSLAIGRVTSLRDENFNRYAFEDSTIRIRTIVVARSANGSRLTDSEIYWTEATVSFADSYIYAARAGVEYNDSIPNMYESTTDEYVWQPTMTFAVKEGESNVVARGKPVFYNVTFGVPYRTVSDIFVQIQSAVPEVQICRLTYQSSGKAIVDFTPPSYKGDLLNTTDKDVKHVDTAFNYQPMVTSYDYGYYVGDVRDSYVSYEAIVMLNDKAIVGTNYSFNAIMKMADGAVDKDTNPLVLDLSTADIAAEKTTLPEVFMGKITDTSETINYGGSEIYYMDIYVPPGTQHHMVVNIFAPWNDTFYGDYEMLEAHIVSVGEHLCCYEHTRTTINITSSSDNIGHPANLAIITLGYVPSVALNGSDEVMIDANKIRIAAHVAIPSNSSLAVGDKIPIAGTIDFSGQHLWVGYIESEVVAHDDTVNEVRAGDLELTLTALESKTLAVGDIRQYEGLMILPAGSSYPELKINILSPIYDGESAIKVFNMTYISSGKHMLELHNDYEVETTDNDFGVSHVQSMVFKSVRNADISSLSDYVSIENETDPGSNDNEFLFSFAIQLLDTVNFVDGYQFDILANVTTKEESLATAVNNDTEVTVATIPEDNAVLKWEVDIVYQPENIVQSSVLVFGMSIYLEEPPLSRRFPSDVIIHYRVPHFSELHDIYNSTVLSDQFIPPTQVEAEGLQFKWKKIRWENMNRLMFNLTIDPDNTLDHGLGDRKIQIPIDVSYRRQNRSNHVEFDEWYEEMRVLTFDLHIPENFDPLGMENDAIQDCQISASSAATPPTDARPGLNGWSSAESRGPPLFKNEYIQVDFSGDVKFTGLTIYPFKDAGHSRVTQLRIQYSRMGIRWLDVVDSSLEPKTFTLSWPGSFDDSTSVFIQFDKSAFIGRHVRLVPQLNEPDTYTSKLRFELHGYSWPKGTVLPSFTCPTADSNLEDYQERQMLAVVGSTELYACTIPSPGKLPYCSGTEDFGESWFAMDDNVLNLYGYDNSGYNNVIYALARDRKTVLRSKDSGHSWQAIDRSLYDAAKVLGTYVEAKTIPFPMNGANTQDLFDNYGTDVGDTKSWSVSQKGIHAYPVDADNVGSKGDSENIVAHWGDKGWD